MKQYLRERGIPMTDFVTAPHAQRPEQVVAQLGIPVVIKDRQESGGRSLIVSGDTATVAHHANRNKIMERYVDAPEASIESFVDGSQILFENVTEYYIKRHANIVPARYSAELQTQLLALNRQVIDALGITWGMTHLETYLTDRGVLFGEIALRPPGGYIMELLSAAYGFSAWDAFVAMELGIPFRFPLRAKQTAGAAIFHPGGGMVRAVEGWQGAASLPSVWRSNLKITAGSTVDKRRGTGEDVGYMLLRGSDPEQVAGDVDRVFATVNFSTG